MFPEFGEDISFRSRVIAIKVKLAPPFSNIFTPLCEPEMKFKLFFDNYSYSLNREHFCSGLVPIGQKT